MRKKCCKTFLRRENTQAAAARSKTDLMNTEISCDCFVNSSYYQYYFYCEAFAAVKIYPEFHKASHSFAEEKGRTTNDKQLFGINGHKCDGFI